MGKPEKKQTESVGDKELLKDVQQFAALLGLGSGAGDGEFDDFAPQKATQKIGGSKDKKQKRVKGAGQSQDGPAAAAAAGAGGGGGSQGRPQQPLANGHHGAGQRPEKQAANQHVQRRGQQNGARQQQQQLQRQPGKPHRQPVSHPAKQRQQGAAGSGGSAARSILPRDEPSIWHEAAAQMAQPPKRAAEAPPAVVEAGRRQAEALLAGEEAAFEADYGRQRWGGG